MADKRRLVQQLPAVLQTDTLKNFFAATLDQLVQPGSSESISGYIGQEPIYYNANTDFYIQEPTAARQEYQLEPGMVSIDNTNAVADSLSYDDLINYLESQGSDTSNHSRLFEGDFYSWAPSVDLDKLSNYNQYLWMGSLTAAEQAATIFTIRAPSVSYVSDGIDTIFALPPVITNVAISAENPAVMVNGILVDADFDSNGNAIIGSASANSGDIVTVYRYGDLTKLIANQASFDYTPFIPWQQYTPGFDNFYTVQGTSGSLQVFVNNTAISDIILFDTTAAQTVYDLVTDMANNTVFEITSPSPGIFTLTTDFGDNVFIQTTGTLEITGVTSTPNLDAPNRYFTGDLVYSYDNYSIGHTYLCIGDNVPSSNFLADIEYWTIATSAQFLTTGSRINIVDAIGTRQFVVDGVGTAIVLSADHTMDANGSAPLYVCIDRRSQEQSPWATRNVWVHKSSLLWNGIDYSSSSRKGTRPIIEFLPNIQLYNYGWNRLPDVQGVMSTVTATVYDNWDIYPYDDNVWGDGQVVLSRINGQLFGRQYQNEYDHSGITSNTVVGSVCVDNGYILQPNDYLFVHQSNGTLEPALNNYIYKIIDQQQTPISYNAVADVIQLSLTGLPQLGDIFRIVPGLGSNTYVAPSAFIDYTEYWFNGVEWVVAQPASALPLFALFDSVGNRLDDQNAYPGSDFEGSLLFSYQVGSGTNDSVLGFPINFDQYGNPIFNVDPDINIVTYNGGAIDGYYYQRFTNNDTYSNNWFSQPNPSTQSLSNAGVYSIPLNLQGNPNNLQVTTISESQWFDDFSEIMTAQVGFTGFPYSTNNWRDTAKDLSNGLKILQHRSPLLKTMLVSSNSTFDLPASIRYADQEYTRFRNKFIQAIINLRTNGTVTASDPDSAWVAAALSSLRLNKSISFPFFGSNMAGGQYFIPPTPASMGLAQCSVPGLVYDNSYPAPILMIKGHDGSLTPAFADWRDNILVALEQQIYANIPSQFKTESRPVVDLASKMNSFFYNGGELFFDIEDVNNILGPYFEKWAQANKIDYHLNSIYDPSDPFTWNYSQSFDKSGNQLPGFWRGIYYFYYDTDRPHLSPWEMLGFIDKPSWWDTQYGPAPYTSGNTKLWNDLRDGIIRGGPRAGTYPRYSRPTLYDYLPVNAEGQLLDPVAAGIVSKTPTYTQATAQWQFGDCAPFESLWRRSSSFQFSWAIVSFLCKPPRYLEQGWDTINNVQDSTGQWIYALTGDRPQNSQLYIHGETINGDYVTRLGVQQWISDYIVSTGQNPSVFGNAVRGLDVRLVHKLAAFTSSDSLTILADNFGEIPSDDIMISLYTSPSINDSFYSGVLIERVNNGWKVVGYDVRKPYFMVIPPELGSPRGIISLSDVQEPVVNRWRPNTYYSITTLIQYDNSVYACSTAHTSGSTFDVKYWTLTGGIPLQAPRVNTYLNGNGQIVKVPYGTVFNTYQQIADFMLGYERWLLSQGWAFTEINPSTQQTMNWSYATEEFLAWAQVNWAIGNFIALSPGAKGITFNTPQGFIFDILNSVTGSYGVINRTGAPVSRKDVIVNRIDNSASIFSKNNDLYGVRLNVGEIEHILIFNNSTKFGNLIYDPLFNLRQPRLLVIGFRSTGWTGILDAPGYILVDGQIKSNFDKAATDLLTMWGIEEADNASLRDYARSTIGYNSRDYLQSLTISPNEQFEFYQGLIHQKGAPGAFDKLLRSDYIDQNRQLNFFEEWALRISEYGALATKDIVSFQLGQTDLLRDPQYIQFTVAPNTNVTNAVTIQNSDWIQLTDTVSTGIDGNWVERPQNPLKTFPQRPNLLSEQNDLPAAGYVRLDEIDYVVFYDYEVPNVYNAVANANLYAGQTIWVHENVTNVVINAGTDTWYVIGQFDPNTDNSTTALGYWDGAIDNSNIIASYLDTDISNNTTFVSKINDAPYVTNMPDFVPVAGETYTITFVVQKLSTATNGVASYISPAFDCYNSNTVTMGMGTVSGTGYNSVLNLIDTSTWALDTYYNVSVTWTCPNSPSYTSAHARLRVNWNGIMDTIDSVYSDATYQIINQYVTVPSKIAEWDALKVYTMSTDGSENYVANVVTKNDDQTISNNTIRVFTLNPHGLTVDDIGEYIVFDGSTFSTQDLIGVQTITAVGPTFFEVSATSTVGFDFTTSENVQAPPVRILRSVHFSSMSDFDAIRNTRPGFSAGDLVYIDGASNQPWAVLQCADITEEQTDFEGNPVYVTALGWSYYRTQPNRVDAKTISSSLIYNLQSKITTTDLQAQPLVLHNFTVVAPLVGIVPGVAMDQIDFMTDFDPAQYPNFTTATQSFASVGSPYSDLAYTAIDNFGDVNGWGKESVGKVWWNLSTVRFLETETDNVSYGLTPDAKYNAEVNYRIKNWGSIAPATSVDVYEWVRSTVDPITYQTLALTDTTGTYVGNVYNGENPNWVEYQEYVANAGAVVTYYYFWVSGLTTTPSNLPSRTMPVATLAQYLINPLVEDEPWMAPIMPNGILVGGAESYVADQFNQSNSSMLTGTVVQVSVKNDSYEGVVHDDWMLLRPNDERSLPPGWMWDILRDSLSGFDDNKMPKPSPLILPSPNPALDLPPIWNPPPRSYNNDYPVWTTTSIPSVNENTSYSQQLQAIDPQGLSLTYSLTSGFLPIGITLTPSGLLSGTAPTTNGISDDNYNFVITASNGHASTIQAFDLDVKYVYIPPTWVTSSPLASVNAYSIYSEQLVATDAQGLPLIYSLISGNLPNGITLSTSGLLSGNMPAASVQGDNYNFTVNVSNGHNSTSKLFSIIVNYYDPVPIWNTTSLPSVGVYNPYSVQLSATDPRNLPLTFSVTSGTLPDGITLSSSGLLSGNAPLASNNYSFAVTASNGTLSSSQSFTITVNYPTAPSSASGYTITPSTLTGTVGTFLDITFTATRSGTVSLGINGVNGLPQGLNSYSVGDGFGGGSSYITSEINGTPISSGSGYFTIPFSENGVQKYIYIIWLIAT